MRRREIVHVEHFSARSPTAVKLRSVIRREAFLFHARGDWADRRSGARRKQEENQAVPESSLVNSECGLRDAEYPMGNFEWQMSHARIGDRPFVLGHSPYPPDHSTSASHRHRPGLLPASRPCQIPDRTLERGEAGTVARPAPTRGSLEAKRSSGCSPGQGAVTP